MNLETLIAQLRERIAAALEERATAYSPVETIRAACMAENGRTPNETEAAQVRAAQAAVEAADVRIGELRAQLTTYETELQRENAAAALQREFTPAAARPAYDQVINRSDVIEPRTYTAHNDRTGTARFFSDAWNARRGNEAARTRLERHGNEVQVHGEITERALATGGVAGLIIPNYLTALAAPVLRSGRPFANAVNRHPMPDGGMTLIVPRGAVGASVDAQATENSAVSETDESWLNLTVPVNTVAGQQPVSRQALERGEQMDTIIFGDLTRAHAAKVDNLVMNGSGASNQPLGALSTAGIGAATAFGAAPTNGNVASKIAGATTYVSSNSGVGLIPRVMVMNPRRWGWYQSLVDSTGRQVVTVNQTGAFQNAAIINAPGETSAGDDPLHGMTFVGLHANGLPIISDVNVPTTVGTNNEDIIFVADTSELHLWEDGDGSPQMLSFEQTAGSNLTTTLVVYSYVAFTGGRYPQAVAKVGGLDSTAGQGLIAPNF